MFEVDWKNTTGAELPRRPWDASAVVFSRLRTHDFLQADAIVSDAEACLIHRAEGHRADGVAAHERRAVQQRAGDARIIVARDDARLLGPVVGEEVREAVLVHVTEMTAAPVGRSGTVRPEGQGRHVHVRHGEGVGAEDGDRDHAVAGRIEGVDTSLVGAMSTSTST